MTAADPTPGMRVEIEIVPGGSWQPAEYGGYWISSRGKEHTFTLLKTGSIVTKTDAQLASEVREVAP